MGSRLLAFARYSKISVSPTIDSNGLKVGREDKTNREPLILAAGHLTHTITTTTPDFLGCFGSLCSEIAGGKELSPLDLRLHRMMLP